MAFVEQAHVNDIGTVFRVTIYDTTATTKNFIFQRPDGTSFTKVATFTTDGSDGKIEYATVDGDLGKAGTWSIQAYVATSGGTWNSSVANFRVFENLS